jgi:hypothetical protein
LSFQFDTDVPDPLHFLTKTDIHPDNRALVEERLARFDALTWIERFRLKRLAWRLYRSLRQTGFWRMLHERKKLAAEYQQIKAAYITRRDQLGGSSNDEKLRLEMKTLYERGAAASRAGRAVADRIDELRETANRYGHVLDHLEFESKHRRELIRRARDEKRIRAQMRQESKWIEELIRDEWRRTNGCHWRGTDRNGREITRTPYFHRAAISADSHWYLLATSQRTMFGYRALLPPNVYVSKLVSEDILENLMAAVGRQIEVERSDVGQIWIKVNRLDSPDGLPKLMYWRELMQYYPVQDHSHVPYIIGAVQNRKLEWLNFSDSTATNLLIGGAPGTGKSNFVNQVVATAVSTHSPDELRLIIVDQKGGMEGSHWEEIPHLAMEITETPDQSLPAFQFIDDLKTKRMKRFKAIKAKTLEEYNRKVDAKERLPRILVVVDEMNTFIAPGQPTGDIHSLILLISSQARAVGINMILATQHPSVQVIPGIIKTQMNVRVSGAMPSDSASMVILDSTIASELPEIAGRMVIGRGNKYRQFQAPLITDDDIADVVAKACKEYGEAIPLKELELDELPAMKVWDVTAFIDYVLENMDGHLSAQKAHERLGIQSPGEHAFKKVVKRIQDRAGENLEFPIKHRGKDYKIIRLKRAYYLHPVQVDQPDTDNSQTGDTSTSDNDLTETMELTA